MTTIYETEAVDMINRAIAQDLATGGYDLTSPMTWDGALCAQVDPELFFPEKGGSTREAKQVCSRCPFQGPCLEYALLQDERFGIWGGVAERERRAMRQARRRTYGLEEDPTDVDLGDLLGECETGLTGELENELTQPGGGRELVGTVAGEQGVKPAPGVARDPQIRTNGDNRSTGEGS